MAITAAHEGVFKHPTYPGLYVVDPSRGDAPGHPELSLDMLRAAAAERRRSRTTRTVVIFAITVVVVYVVLSGIGYNAFSSALIAIGAGIVADSILLPLLYRPGQPVAVDAAIESGAALGLQSLDTFGVPVDDSVSWPALWQLASAYAVVDEEQSTLDELDYFADSEARGDAAASAQRAETGRPHPVTEFDVDRQRARVELALAEADTLAARLGFEPPARSTGDGGEGGSQGGGGDRPGPFRAPGSGADPR